MDEVSYVIDDGAIGQSEQRSNGDEAVAGTTYKIH